MGYEAPSLSPPKFFSASCREGVRSFQGAASGTPIHDPAAKANKCKFSHQTKSLYQLICTHSLNKKLSRSAEAGDQLAPWVVRL
jgi:hypothetical protein